MPRERKYEPAAEDQRDYPADFEEVLAGNGRPLHIHFGDWVAEKTDAASHFKTVKELQAFKLGTQFGIRYRMDHQSSLDGGHAFHAAQRENRDSAAEEKAARDAERKNLKAKAAAEEAPAPAPAPKRRGRPAKAVEEVAEPEPTPAPKRRGRPAGRAAAAETPAPKAEASARPARRPAAAGKPGRPARRGAGGTEPAF